MRSSKAELPATDEGVGYVFRETTWGAMRAEIDTFDKQLDMTPRLRDWPEGLDPVPHWGYIIKGQARAIYKNHEEAFHEGDLFYVEPGHTMIFGTGTECVMFSPEDQLQGAVAHARHISKPQK